MLERVVVGVEGSQEDAGEDLFDGKAQPWYRRWPAAALGGRGHAHRRLCEMGGGRKECQYGVAHLIFASSTQL